jgi:hemerythrin
MTTYIAWREYYTVGDPSLDAEHQQIIGIINELYDAMQKGLDQKTLTVMLDRLVGYTFAHFKSEEQTLQEHDYPDLAEHKALHDEIRQKTLDLREHASLVTAHDLMRFLKEWWLGHIQNCDKKYAPYLDAPLATGAKAPRSAT